MIENRELLAEYVESGSEEAFGELVRRYIDLVYSTALRLVGGDRHSAQDVTQTVFLHLSQTARRLPREVMLGGWLHRDTCNVANNLRRGARRRRAREQQAAIMESMPDHTKANLDAVAHILDEAINLLEEEDRTAILLRFFERLDFRAVGAALDSSEDAARMRVARAVEKLHGLLGRRGVAFSAAALASALAGEAASGAPAGLAASVAAAALAGSATGSSGTAAIIKIMAMSKINAGIIGTIIVSAAAIPLWIQHQDQKQMHEENLALRQQLQQLSADNERLSNQVAQASTAPATTPEQERDLIRLRGEVGNLRRQVAEAAKAQAKAEARAQTSTQTSTNVPSPDEEKQQAAFAKLNFGKGWMMTFMLYAQHNADQLPTSFEQAAPFMPQEEKSLALAAGDKYGVTTDQYEIVYQGSLKSIESPASTIVIREKQALQQTDGSWVRAYAFADGHSEIHRSADGNFAPWEAQHMAAPQAATPGQ